MDFQNRAGAKAGGGGNLSYAERNVDRRERLRLLALEVTDIKKDPYIIRNSIGSYECKLCGTTHNNEGNYLSHTQGKKHSTNLMRRNIKINGPNPSLNNNNNKIDNNANNDMNNLSNDLKLKNLIGKPVYILHKIRDSTSKKFSIFIEIQLPEIKQNVTPEYKIVSAFEQKVETKNYNVQYIVVAAEPYETIGFKIPNKDIDLSEDYHKSNWDDNRKLYTLLITFK